MMVRRSHVLAGWLVCAMATTVLACAPRPKDGAVAAAPAATAILIGAGDIATCEGTGDEATALLLDRYPTATIFTAGDNAYGSGTPAEFQKCYGPSWGRHKVRTRPSPGNHDYGTPGGRGYYEFFGANAGDSTKGYYSYELGGWRVIALNSNIAMAAGSPQEKWLRAELAAQPEKCTLAYWHYARFSSAEHGNDNSTQPLWQALYDGGAEVVVVGHDHSYERFAPQDGGGKADSVRGVREFVAGMGGASHYGLGARKPNSEVFDSTTFGVLKFTLTPTTYAWEFVPVAGGTFRDAGIGKCR